ncbi:MAG: ImmA/IrrE family metallo-endopeptidase [Roseococcus sp.]|nr:ImmA/IrrE family metallo-endopeptidase [Roseococcus sp.]
MPIEVAYAPGAALSSRTDAAAATIRGVAAQVRRQVPREPDSLAVTLLSLIDACRAVEVNGRALSVSWELGRALRDELGQTVLGLCDIDAHEPGWAYIAVNGPMTANRPDLALSTAAHELGHLLFDVPAALARGEQRYHAVASSPQALERAGRGAEARANEFMGALLAPPVPLHTRLLAYARSEGLRLTRGPHQGRPASPIVAASNPHDTLAGVMAALAGDFGVSERFIAVRLSRYGLVEGGV